MIQFWVACLQLTLVIAAPSSDEIVSLPGWNGVLPSKQYSGYLTAAKGDRHLHYWFVESESGPSKSPVVVWFNGKCTEYILNV
jgi:carboxypeptidase C (cathepsin A)